MKKIICLFTVAVLLFALCSCAPKKEKEIKLKDILDKPFSCNVSMTAGSAGFAGSLLKKSNKDFTLKMARPEEMKDMTFRYDEGAIRVGFLGLEFGFSENTMPVNAMAGILFALFAPKDDDKAKMDLSGDQIRISGKIPAGNYEFYLNKKTQIPEKAVLKELNTELAFSDYKLLEN